MTDSNYKIGTKTSVRSELVGSKTKSVIYKEGIEGKVQSLDLKVNHLKVDIDKATETRRWQIGILTGTIVLFITIVGMFITLIICFTSRIDTSISDYRSLQKDYSDQIINIEQQLFEISSGKR